MFDSMFGNVIDEVEYRAKKWIKLEQFSTENHSEYISLDIFDENALLLKVFQSGSKYAYYYANTKKKASVFVDPAKINWILIDC